MEGKEKGWRRRHGGGMKEGEEKGSREKKRRET